MTEVYDRQCANRTEFQKLLHTPELDDRGEIDMSSITSLCLQKPLVRCFWYSQIPKLMEHGGSNFGSTGNKSQHSKMFDNPSKVCTTKWKFESSLHYAVAGYARRIMPRFCVQEKFRDEYRICLPHNPAVAPLISIKMLTSKSELSAASLHATNINFQFFNKNGTEASFNLDVGNLESLEEWSHYLHEGVGNFTIPLPYNTPDDTKCGFPLWRFDESDKLRIEVTEELSVTRILRMQRKVGSGKSAVWKNCPVDLNVLEECDAILPETEIYCSYTYNTETELADKRKDPEPYKYIYKDFVTFSAGNVSDGSPQSVTFKTSSPAEAVYWVPENTTLAKFNVYSNYSTDSECVYQGGDPISLNTVSYGSDMLVEDWPSDHFSQSQPRVHAFSIPHAPGYHMLAFGNAPHFSDPDVGIVFSAITPGTVSVTYRSPNTENESKNTYKLHVVARVTRCITFTPTDPGNENTRYTKTVEPA